MNERLARGREALASARLLLDAGHDAGAANRPYYAIFHAARAVVPRYGEVKPSEIKTHHGLRRMFELYVVKPGLMDQEIAAHFNDVESTRWVADYGNEPRDAEAFVEACEQLLQGQKP